MQPTFLLFGIGTQEIILIALLVLLVFGGKKIPELMKGLGKGVKSFKDGMNGMDLDGDAKENDKESTKESQSSEKESTTEEEKK